MATTYTLTEPIEVDGEQVTELQVRRLKVRDIRAASKRGKGDDVDMGVHMVALVTDLTPEQVDELDAADFVALSEVVAGFLRFGHFLPVFKHPRRLYR